MIAKAFVLGFLVCISLTHSAPVQQKRSIGGLGWGAPIIPHSYGLGGHGLGLSTPIVQTIQTIKLPTIKASYVPINTIPSIGSIGHIPSIPIGHIPSISSIPAISTIGHLPSISSIGHLPSISSIGHIGSIAPIALKSIPIETDISLLGGHIGSPTIIESGLIGHSSPIISSGHGLIGDGIIGGGIIKGGVIGGHGVYGGSSIW